MSLKDQGNKLFKSGKYRQAIRCYEQYIQHDPQADKKVAFTNISFCHYKLQQWQQSIQTADEAICEEPTYQKAYYRKVMAFKAMPDHQYEVYINFHLLLKHCKALSEKDQHEYRAQMKQWKQKWLAKTKSVKGKQIQKEDNWILEGINQDGGQFNENQEKPVDQWIQQWNSHPTKWKEHWEQIALIAKENSEKALNLAYLYLNQLSPDAIFYSDIKNCIKDLQASLSVKMKVEETQKKEQNEEVPLKQPKSQSSDENLFESSEHSDHLKQTKNVNESKQEDVGTRKDKVIEKTQKVQNVPVVKEEKKGEKMDIEEKEVSEQFQAQVQKEIVDIPTLYKRYMQKGKVSRDPCLQLIESIEQILSSKLSHEIKQQLLIEIKKKEQKNVSMMKKSLSKKEQQKVFGLLSKNNLKEFVPDFASKHNQ